MRFDRVARALESSRHEDHFRGWATALMMIGLVIFTDHVAIYLLQDSGLSILLRYWLSRTAMFAVLLLMLWRVRLRVLLPTNAAERVIWWQLSQQSQLPNCEVGACGQQFGPVQASSSCRLRHQVLRDITYQ